MKTNIMTGRSGRVENLLQKGINSNSHIVRSVACGSRGSTGSRPTNRAQGLGLEEVEAWPEPVDGAALLEELRRVLRRYVVLPKMAPETLALWVVHTYAFELPNVST